MSLGTVLKDDSDQRNQKEKIAKSETKKDPKRSWSVTKEGCRPKLKESNKEQKRTQRSSVSRTWQTNVTFKMFKMLFFKQNGRNFAEENKKRRQQQKDLIKTTEANQVQRHMIENPACKDKFSMLEGEGEAR